MSMQQFFRRWACHECKRLYQRGSGRPHCICLKCKKETVGVGGHLGNGLWALYRRKGYLVYVWEIEKRGKKGSWLNTGRCPVIRPFTAKKKRT
jgi:hypothetical protein